MGFIRALLSPFVSTFWVAAGMWNRTGDWGWHISLRIFATLAIFAGLLLFFYWGFVGF